MEEAASAAVVVSGDLKAREDRLVRLAKYFLHHDESDPDFQKALATKASLLTHYSPEKRNEAWVLFVKRASGDGGYAAMTLPAMLISLDARLSSQELVNAGVFYRDLFPVQKYTKFRDAVWQTKIRPFLIGRVSIAYDNTEAVKARDKLLALPANANCDQYKHALRELIFSLCKHENFYYTNVAANPFYQQLHTIYLFLGGNLSLEKIIEGAKEEQQRLHKMDKRVNAGLGGAACGIVGDGALAFAFYCCAPVTPPFWVYVPLGVISAVSLAGTSALMLNRNHPVVSSCWNPAAPIQQYRSDKNVAHPVFVRMTDSSVKDPVKRKVSIFSSVKSLFFCCADTENSGELKPLLSVNADERPTKTKTI